VARSSSGGRGGLRTLALVAAVAIALASTAAVVLSDDPQTLRLAVVGALWAFVLAAFAAPRRQEPDAPAGDPGTALELRRTYEIELAKEVAARREYELQLEVYLRREMERGLAEDVAALREEVGRMRGEMIDRLDGELRMERIETTRLIGGSLRALQDEARRLGIGLPVPPELAADYPPEPARDGPAGFGPADGPAAFGPANGPAGFAPANSPAGFGPASGPAGCGPANGPAGFGPASGPAGFGPAGYGPANGTADGPAGFGPADGPAGGWVDAGGPSGRSNYPQPGGFGDPAPPSGPAYRTGPAPPYPAPEPAPPVSSPRSGPPPAPRAPTAGESVPRRRRRAREDGEDNEVMSRLLGR